ncbi:hypothetical protein V5F77_25740 [Xanthobacter sp. DSM 24535]|uniref:hypothetical protein n=1 Tax=Roseixanthobacter psychrophilus TaxID=3119917 RepID=UPI003729424B
MKLHATIGFLVVAIFATPCIGADLPTTPSRGEAAAATVPSGWTFQATVYGWATALNGDIGIKHLPPSSVDVSAWDAITHLNGALMGSFLAKNGDWIILTDLIWASISDRAAVGANGTQVSFSETQITASAIVGYRLPVSLPENIELSGTVGLRYQHLSADIGISPAVLPIFISREGTQDWVDPTIGLSLQYKINDTWFLNALADIGGFGIGSKLTAQGFASVGYMWTPSISTALGYRAIYTDYESGGFVYNTTQHGVFSSIAYHF